MRWSGNVRIELRLWLKGLLMVAVPLAPLAAVALSMRAHQSEQWRAVDRLRQTVQVQREIHALRTGLMAAETAVGMYLLQGREESLEPYKTARVAMPARLKSLDALLGGDSSQYKRLERLQPLVERQLEILSAQRKYASVPGVALHVPPGTLLAEGRGVMSRIQAILGELQREEDLRSERASEQDWQSQRRAGITLLATLALGLLGSVAAVWLLMTGTVKSERRRAEEAFQGSQRQLRDMLKGTETQIRELSNSDKVLRYQAHIFQSVLAGMLDGVMVAGEDGGLLYCNEASSRILEGLPYTHSSKWVTRYGLCLADGKTPCPSADFPLERALRGADVDQAVLFASRGRGKQGIWISLTARPLRDESGAVKGAVLVLTDISSHKRKELILSQSRDGAERVIRGKSDFLSRMSHELRTQLHAVLGSARLMETARLKPRQHEGVVHILRASQRLLRIVDDVQDISRLESGRLALSSESVPATDLLREALGLVEPQAAARQVRVNWELVAGGSLCIRGDRQRLTQVLLNLLSAAIQFNRPGGAVAISCRETANGRVRIQIGGAGIRPEEADLLFRPFERLAAAEADGESTGAGLLLSKRLVEAMDGTIGVENQGTAGTAIRMELPATAASTDESAPTSAEDLAAAARALLDAQLATLLGIESPRRQERVRESTG